jgi:hypothetical protein
MGEWVGSGVCKWAREREREIGRERGREREREIGRDIGRERERDCLLLGAEIVSSIVMYNFGGGPRGDPLFQAF